MIFLKIFSGVSAPVKCPYDQLVKFLTKKSALTHERAL